MSIFLKGNKMKFIKTLAIIAICSMLLVACSGGDDNKEVLKYDEVTKSTLGKNKGKEPKTGIGFDGKEISLGIITPQTGNAGFLGNAIKSGSQTYWDSKNNTGGVAGKYRVALIDEDSAANGTYDKALSISAYDKLSPKVVAFQHVLGTDVVLAIKDRQLKDTKLVMPATLASSFVRDPLTVPITNAYPTQAINGIGYYLESTVVEKPVICSLSLDDTYGDDSNKGVEYATKKLGVKYGTAQKFTTGSSVSSQVDAIVASKCNAVVFAGTAIDIKVVLEAFASKASDVDVIGLSPAWIPQVDLNLTSASKTYAAEHFYIVSAGAKWGDTSVPGMDKMMEDVANFKPNQISNPFFMFGYAQAWAMDQILEEAVKNGDLSPAGVAKALSNINTFDFEGLIPSYEYGPNTSSRVVPNSNTIFVYSLEDKSKLVPVSNDSIDYINAYTPGFKYTK